MALSAFADEHHPPTEADLRSTLGAAYGPWARLIELVSTRTPPILQVWGFTTAATGCLAISTSATML